MSLHFFSSINQSTSVYWRGDPNTKKAAPTSDNWPRNGALLKGTGPHNINGEDWMKDTGKGGGLLVVVVVFHPPSGFSF